MVFNKFTHLARPSLSKTLTHGYAQSVVAATQTSAQLPLAKHHKNKSSRPSATQQHAPFTTISSTPAVPSHASRLASESPQLHDSGLRTYFEAWQRLHQHGEEVKEWKQFQFPKAIEAKPQSAPKEGIASDDSTLPSRTEPSIDRTTIDRTLSSSAVEDIKKAEAGGEHAAIAKVNAAIASVIEDIRISTVDIETTGEPQVERASPKDPTSSIDSARQSPSLESAAEAETALSTPPSIRTTERLTNAPPDVPAQLQKIYELSRTQQYGEIPPAFESALAQGIIPTPKAYNALLASAKHLSLSRKQLAPKALEMYADMLRRNVTPDALFYTELLDILSQQALYYAQVKRELEHNLHRFRMSDDKQSSLLPSKLTELNMVAEDDALSNAIAVFSASMKSHVNRILSSKNYQLLIHACAQQQNIGAMVQIYRHMEDAKVKPISNIYPAMIQAFSEAADLESAIECYNRYRDLAIADDSGDFVIIGRSDADVYCELIKAFARSGKPEASQHFVDKITQSFASSSEERLSQLKDLQMTINVKGLFQSLVDSKNFVAAQNLISQGIVPPHYTVMALSALAIKAADESATETACSAYDLLVSTDQPSAAVNASVLAMHVRCQAWSTASMIFQTLSADSSPSIALLEPTAFYTHALLQHGKCDEAFDLAQNVFRSVRASPQANTIELTDHIDEIIQVFGDTIGEHGTRLRATASIKLMNIMLENGGLISAVAGKTLAGLGPEEVAGLAPQDVIVALQVEAAVIANATSVPNPAHSSRLDHLIELATRSGSLLDSKTTGLVNDAAEKLASQRSDILEKWNGYKQSLREPNQFASNALTSPLVQPAQTMNPEDSFDPYASSTDYRGSSVIIDELDNHRNARGLKEALTRFRNIRRAGRHPRYIVYAKLIASAAKEGRINLTHDILGMARTDMPYLSEYPIVRHGWSAILDAMVGACLTAGKRALADQYHREMLDIGVVPSANTYGLYITTLKASTKTFDEASEAVKIFQRALSEGVVPSSFLYNALIGKLGKARRIDDCLRYFQEMRAAGVRPTSVTYGTVVNALCRVSDERFAEELFDEMESMPNYKPRPAPYNSLMQYFLTTKRDSQKVLAYYDRMQSVQIEPTMHTYKLLIDTYATLEPINLSAAEGVLEKIRDQGLVPEAVHYASLIHAKGCVLHDMKGAKAIFDAAIACKDFPPQASLYQALFESMVANHCVADTEPLLDLMSSHGVEMTPYIANTLIHGWAMDKSIGKSKAIYDSVGIDRREPSTYESMTRAYLTAEDHKGALATIHEMLSRGYPSAVSNKIVELVGHGTNRAGSGSWPSVIA